MNASMASTSTNHSEIGLAENSAEFFYSDASQTAGRVNDIARQCISLNTASDVFFRFGFQIFNPTDPAQLATFELISPPKFTLISALPITV